MAGEMGDGYSVALRRRLHLALFVQNRRNRASLLIHAVINTAILVSIGSLILEHMAVLNEQLTRFFTILDDVTLAIFSIEYFARALSGGMQPKYKGKSWPTLRYLLSPMALLDLLVIMPFFVRLESVVDLRFLRVIRLLKIARTLRPVWQEFRKINVGRGFRQKLYSALNADRYSGRLNETIDFAMGKFIFLSVAAVMLETVESIHEPLAREFHWFDVLTILVFTLEYIARVYCCVENEDYRDGWSGRLRYMMSGVAIIDLLSILPFYLGFIISFDLRFLRAVRLLRLLKFTRYSTAMSTLTQVVGEQTPALSAAFFTTIIVTIFSASIIYLVEHEAQPDKFTSIPEATYWAIITLLSVGYGDLTPVTPLGKFMTMIVSLMGLGLVALPAGILASGFSQKMQERSEAFKAMVDAKVRDGGLSDQDRLDLKLKAEALGLGHYREAELEQEELAAFKRLQQEARLPQPLPPRQVASSTELALSYSDFDALLLQIDKLTQPEKIEVMARIAQDLHRPMVAAVPVSE